MKFQSCKINLLCMGTVIWHFSKPVNVLFMLVYYVNYYTRGCGLDANIALSFALCCISISSIPPHGVNAVHLLRYNSKWRTNLLLLSCMNMIRPPQLPRNYHNFLSVHIPTEWTHNRASCIPHISHEAGLLAKLSTSTRRTVAINMILWPKVWCLPKIDLY